jgi:predicted DCC family thiol-disulfide oxidoreductase YuxK
MGRHSPLSEGLAGDWRKPGIVRERLHVLDETGKLRVGASAFEALWSHTPEQARLASFLRLRGIDKLAEWTYNLFARVLYKWNRANHRW